MPLEIEITLNPREAHDEVQIQNALRANLSPHFALVEYRILKRSIDARHGKPRYIFKIAAYEVGENIPGTISPRTFHDVTNSKRIIIIGAGPAGLFAALCCIELGLKPIIIERGKDVRERRRDLAAIHKNHIVNPDSNYCFGEGGAGTYSDGKLYTRSTKRGDVQSVLETLVQFGAEEEILFDAHPHIGTNKLPKIIASMRDKVRECGGEVYFNKKLVDLNIDGNKVRSIITSDGEIIAGEYFILATGHSAKDIYELLHKKNIRIEFKPFALGVRAEHPQGIIDSAQYHSNERSEFLPPAAYSLVQQVEGRGVYSFCMCPGGIIAPCATQQDEIVTNGWSPSKRNNPWANSGIVVPVSWEDIPEFHTYGPLAGLMFQHKVEHDCWNAAGKTQAAPAQRLIDFVEGKKSKDLPACSYQPGLVSVNLHEILPPFIARHLREGLKAFGKKINGYYTNDAVLAAPESRTSSPVRIPREKEELNHVEIKNLFPAGEGAGYAGGIVSAAIDGEKIAKRIAEILSGN